MREPVRERRGAQLAQCARMCTAQRRGAQLRVTGCVMITEWRRSDVRASHAHVAYVSSTRVARSSTRCACALVHVSLCVCACVRACVHAYVFYSFFLLFSCAQPQALPVQRPGDANEVVSGLARVTYTGDNGEETTKLELGRAAQPVLRCAAKLALRLSPIASRAWRCGAHEF